MGLSSLNKKSQTHDHHGYRDMSSLLQQHGKEFYSFKTRHGYLDMPSWPQQPGQEFYSFTNRGYLDMTSLLHHPGIDFNSFNGAQWLSGRVLDSRPKDRGFEPYRCHCVVSLSKNINPSLVLVQPRKTRPFITERLLMGRRESNQTNKQTYHVYLDMPSWPQQPGI